MISDCKLQQSVLGGIETFNVHFYTYGVIKVRKIGLRGGVTVDLSIWGGGLLRKWDDTVYRRTPCKGLTSL